MSAAPCGLSKVGRQCMYFMVSTHASPSALAWSVLGLSQGGRRSAGKSCSSYSSAAVGAAS